MTTQTMKDEKPRREYGEFLECMPYSTAHKRRKTVNTRSTRRASRLSVAIEHGRLRDPSAEEVDRLAAMGLYQILEGLLLLVNAFAILNEGRFLIPMGLGFGNVGSGSASFKGQLIGFIHAMHYFRVPLVIANGIVISSKLLFG